MVWFFAGLAVGLLIGLWKHGALAHKIETEFDMVQSQIETYLGPKPRG